MKKEYSKYIKSKLKEIIPNEFPCFVFLDEQKKYGLDYNFVDSTGENWKMISIQNDKNSNAFTIEIFWSKTEEPCLYESTLFSNIELQSPLKIEDEIWKSLDKVRVRLSDFWIDDFDSWWAIDPTGKIIKSIEKYGFITSDAYFKFYSEDSFLSDEKDLSEEEFKEYIDPLIYNVVELLKKYAIPLFECVSNK